jgi:hypothetical protein
VTAETAGADIDDNWPNLCEIKAMQASTIADAPNGWGSDAAIGGVPLVCEGGIWQTTTGRIWVPEAPDAAVAADNSLDMRMRLLVISHMGIAGHRGRGATAAALTKRFWWPEIDADTRCVRP